MTKAKKAMPKKSRAFRDEEKLAIEGSFVDVIQVSVAGNPKAKIREEYSTPLESLKLHILKAKELFGPSLEAVSISSNFHSKILKSFRDNLVKDSMNGFEITIKQDQDSDIEIMIKEKK